MQRKKLLLVAGIATCLAFGGLSSDVLADKKIEGTYTAKRWGSGSDVDVKIWIEKDGNSYRVTRKAEFRDGTTTLHKSSKTRLTSWGYLYVDFSESGGLAGNLDGSGDSSKLVAKAWYWVNEDSGQLWGSFRELDDEGKVKYRMYEQGKKGDDEPLPGDDTTDPGDDDDPADDDPTDDDADVRIKSPRNGTVLAGQTLEVELEPADAELTIDGPAEKTDGGLKLTGAGTVTLKAKKGNKESAAITLEAVTAEVTEVKVLDAIRLADARPPHFKRGLGSDDHDMTPAAIFKGKKLKLQIKLKGAKNLSRSARVNFEASDDSVKLSGSVNVRNLKTGSTVTVESEGVLSDGVTINSLELTAKIGDQELDGKVALRIYTSYKAPIKNIDRDRNAPNTVRHFEKACGWANDASQNIGRGDESIGYQVDNRMRHYVHWQDLGSKKPVVPDYPEGASAPLNYDDIYGYVNPSTGERRISSLYYPPLKPKKEYEKYHNYRNNYGWWVLDNPKYAGGRCNQQASLVCGILGTLGLKGEILYLHRYGTAKNSGRPVRQYFYSNDAWPAPSAQGGGPWNFHGVALITMEDGSQWIYDGSFSSPPNRKNGTREWAENEGGPFVHTWGPWLYEDAQGGRVPASDVPNSWYGVQPKDTN